MHNINYIWILEADLQHVSVQVYNLQAEQYAIFKTNSYQWAIIYKFVSTK